MHQIKVIAFESPRLLRIIHLEFHVRWYPLWLDRAQVRADYFCVRVFVCAVDGPDSGPRADVEDCGWFFCGGGEGGLVEFVGHGEAEGVVLQVHALLFCFVVGEDVAAFFGCWLVLHVA